MKSTPVVLVSVLLLALAAGCYKPPERAPQASPRPTMVPAAAPSPVTQARPMEARHAHATLQFREGMGKSGSVMFDEVEQGMRVTARVSGVAPGKHGIHLHEKGDCSAADFTSAGEHWNPTGEQHGGPDSPSHHLGDLGNITVDDQGNGELQLTVPRLTVGPGPYSVVGKAIVLHAGEDDLTSQPAGNSGDRIACGVLAMARSGVGLSAMAPGMGMTETRPGERPGTTGMPGTGETTDEGETGTERDQPMGDRPGGR